MKLINHFLTTLFFSLLAYNTSAQTVDPKLAAAFQRTLDSMHQILNIKGMGAAVQLSNDSVWAGGSGHSTFFPVDKIGPDHAFELGSTTKTITGACILQMVDEGLLTLDDSLHQWIDTIPFVNPNITIRQLLRHQSGIYDVLQSVALNTAFAQQPNKIWQLESVVRGYISSPSFQPGQGWEYSNTNYMLLGVIIEKVTGLSFAQAIRTRFLTTLGLNSYANPAYDALPVPTAHLWLDITGDNVLDDAHVFLSSRKSLFSAISSAGGYYGKPSDLAKWIRKSMNGSLFSVDTWTEATTTVQTNLPNSTRYGLGLSTIFYLGLKGFGHGGDLGGFTTQAFYFPEKDISIVVCGNDATINSWKLTNTVKALLKTCIDYQNTSSIGFIEDTEALVSVSPNPFSDRITMSIRTKKGAEALQYALVDVAGRVVWKSNPKKINPNQLYEDTCTGFSDVPSGFYFMTIKDGADILKVVKIIK